MAFPRAYNSKSMQRQRTYEYQGKTYPATITYKRMRSLTLRIDQEKGTLRVSVPILTPLKAIDDFVTRSLPKIVKKVSKKKDCYDGQNLYVFGELKEVGELEPREIGPFYKKVGLPYLKKRVEEFSSLMGVDKVYKVRMREMKRTFGSNSRRTLTLTFQARLIAFAPEIIDSVVVHELAHHFVFDHSRKFYDVVYRYCPNYDQLRRKLIHDQFAG